jgi:hypothetical protein
VERIPPAGALPLGGESHPFVPSDTRILSRRSGAVDSEMVAGGDFGSRGVDSGRAGREPAKWPNSMTASGDLLQPRLGRTNCAV